MPFVGLQPQKPAAFPVKGTRTKSLIKLDLFLAYSDILQLITILCLSFSTYWVGRKSLRGRLVPWRFTENRSYTIATILLISTTIKSQIKKGTLSRQRMIYIQTNKLYQLLYIWPEFCFTWKQKSFSAMLISHWLPKQEELCDVSSWVFLVAYPALATSPFWNTLPGTWRSPGWPQRSGTKTKLVCPTLSALLPGFPISSMENELTMFLWCTRHQHVGGGIWLTAWCHSYLAQKPQQSHDIFVPFLQAALLLPVPTSML